MLIKIKFFDNTYDGDNEIKKANKKMNWIDLRSRKDIHIEKGSFAMIPLGVAMQLPEGYEAHIVPRSSTFKNWGVIQTNHMGIIDETYCGDTDEWCMPVYATRDTDIKKGDRVCQFRIMEHQPDFDFHVVEFLNNASRGGFGSTGKS